VPLAHRFFELYKLFHQYCQKFPKQEKYSLGEKIESLILELLELTFNALSRPKNEKLLVVRKISSKNDLLKILIRLCYEIKLIDQKKYIRIQEYLQEIGEMIGGWLNSLLSKEAS